jgi:hypothetical protein
MRRREYPPLFPNGFKDIQEQDLHNEFVECFNYGKDHRTNLLIGFGQFLKQFKELNLTAEVWIDGSFATTAPDPDDVDVVFYFVPSEVDKLTDEKKEKFERLFLNREFMKKLYQVEVFYGIMGDTNDYSQWRSIFGTCYDNTTPKGIFRLFYN